MAKQETQETLWGDYKEVKEGDTEETKISEVTKGVLGDFKSPEYFEKVESDKREQARKSPAVQVLCANGAKMEIILPRGDTYGPKSVIAAWKKTYRKLPEVGDAVSTERDENGFWRIQLKMLR